MLQQGNIATKSMASKYTSQTPNHMKKSYPYEVQISSNQQAKLASFITDSLGLSEINKSENRNSDQACLQAHGTHIRAYHGMTKLLTASTHKNDPNTC